MPAVKGLLPEVTRCSVPISLAHASALAMPNSMAQGSKGKQMPQVMLPSLRTSGSEGAPVLHTEAVVLVPESLGQLSPPEVQRTIILILPRMSPEIFNMAKEEKFSFSHPAPVLSATNIHLG